MHRSGTSAMAGLLHNNGIIMGEEKNFIPSPSKQNPKGFYENYLFRTLNDKILLEYHYKAKSFSPLIPVITESRYETDMKYLVHNYNMKYKKWGWKDPRTSLTLKVWMKLIKKPYIIVMHRDKSSVVNSMIKRRNGKKEKLESLYDSYYNSISMFLPNKRVKHINFEDLCDNTKKISNSISSFLKHPIKDLKFIDKRLNHN